MMMRQVQNMVTTTRKFAQQKTARSVQALQVNAFNIFCISIDFSNPNSTAGLDDEDVASMTHHSETSDPSLIWPSMQDLNTRLRRVITSYQRNYKKEELKQQQKAKVRISSVQVDLSV